MMKSEVRKSMLMNSWAAWGTCPPQQRARLSPQHCTVRRAPGWGTASSSSTALINRAHQLRAGQCSSAASSGACTGVLRDNSSLQLTAAPEPAAKGCRDTRHLPGSRGKAALDTTRTVQITAWLGS